MDVLTVNEVANIVQRSSKSSNPSELAVKGLHFGRLYFKVGDYAQAADWILKYIRKFDRDFQAHRLLGECYEKLSVYDAALDSYKQSLHIKPNQYDLVVHVAELFLIAGPYKNPSKAQVWLDKAAAALPGDPKVFSMKMELLQAQQASTKTLEKVLLKELRMRPNDVALHVQYVSFLQTQGMIAEAFAYCKRTSNFVNNRGFDHDCKWLSTSASIYKEYIDSYLGTGMNSSELSAAYCFLLDALTRLIWQCISEKKFQETFRQFSKMDQCLSAIVNQNLMSNWQPVIEEMMGQFACIAGTLLIHQAQQSSLAWKDACRYASFFYFISLSKPLLSLSSAWAMSCSQSLPNLPLRLHRHSAIRISQSSHLVWILKKKLGDAIEDISSASAVGNSAHQILFGSSSDEESSFFYFIRMKGSVAPIPVAYMSQYDEVAALNNDLHMLVWLGLRWLDLEEYSDFLPWAIKAFPSLKLIPFPTSSSASILSLNLLDVEAFLAGCVFTVKKKLNDWKQANVVDPLSLSAATLPASLCRRLTTDLQEKWWKAATQMSSKTLRISASESAKLKPILQRGLECLRGIGNHGLDTILVTKLAKYFAAKAYSLLDGDNVTSAWLTYQRKASAYWTLITPELGRLSDGVAVHHSSRDPLFPSFFHDPSADNAKALLSEAYMCRGELAARENQSDDAISFYGKASIPQASFCQAHIYKKMLENLESDEILEPQIDLNRKKELLAKKYRHCLEVTLSRLQQQPDESLHEKTIRLLSSPHVSPPRPLGNKSVNESVLSPGKQSTPKVKSANTSAVATPLVEKEAVHSLVDTITTLTSALSSLQLEMEYLREENRLMRQSSPQVYNNPPQPHRLSQGLSPAMLHLDGMQRPMQTITPQRTLVPPNPQLMAYGREGVEYSPGPPQAFQNVYSQQQSQAYYTSASGAYVTDDDYPTYADNGALLNGGGYSVPVNQYSNVRNVQVGDYQRTTMEALAAQSAHQSSNLLAAALQNKDKEALQQKFGSILSDMRTPAAAAKPEFPALQGKIFNDPVITNVSSSDGHTSQKPIAKSSQLHQLLGGGEASITATPVSTKEFKPNLKVNLPPQTTPVSKAQEVHFLEGFVSPKSPGTNMKFQSPEQMDQENKELEALEQADNDTSTNADVGPHFDPIIPLPDLVEIKTGEEEEDGLFSERCKLYRWDDSQWKERGLGEMKLLKHKSTGKARLVMRREQVLKVCCNHHITSTIQLSPMPSSERAMVWFARDYADDEPKDEKLAARFKTVEIAEKFRDLVNREAAAIESGTPKKEETKATIDAAAAKFKFGFTPSNAQVPEKPQPQQEEDAVKPSPFSNLASALSSSSFAGSGPNGGIKVPQNKFSFGAPKPKAKEPTEKEDVDDEVVNTSQHDNSRVEDEDGPDHEPIIDLPDLVEAKTGEEEEEVVFCHRAKLFRHVSPEWKERGVGDMKILINPKTGKYRLVMRREQVMKLCANHLITTGMKLSAQGSSEKSWSWTALDYAEDPVTPQHELLAIKFKTVEEAKKFQEKFMEGVAAADKGRSSVGQSAKTIPPTSPSQAAKAFLQKELKDNRPGSDNWMCVRCKIINISTSLWCVKCKDPKPKPTQMFGLEAAPGEPAAVSSTAPSSQRSDPGKGENAASKSSGHLETGHVETGHVEAPSGNWTCRECYASNSAQYKVCMSCHRPFSNVSKPKSVSTSSVKSGFNLPPKPAGNWTCRECLASNKESDLQCPCCETPNPNLETPTTTKPVKTGFNLPPKPAGNWSCRECLASNKESDLQCPCCGTPNPNLQTPTTTKPVKSGFHLPPKPAGSWSCRECLASNKESDLHCPCCETPNPNLQTPTTTKPEAKPKEDKFIMTFGTNIQSSTPSTGGFSFGIQQSTAGQKPTAISKQHPTLQRAGGSKPSAFSPFQFGVPQNTTSTAFSSSPAFGSFQKSDKSDLKQSGDIRVPDEEDEEYDDESDTTAETSGTYSECEESEEEEEKDVEGAVHQSPMSRFAAQGQVTSSETIMTVQQVSVKSETVEVTKTFQLQSDKEPAAKDTVTSEVTSSTQKSAPFSFVKDIATSEVTSTTQKSDPFSFGSGSTASFSDLAAGSGSGSGSSFSFASSAGKFAHMWQPESKPMFSDTQQSTSDTHEQSTEHEHEDSYDADNIYIKPIIDLPKKVVIETGEENETTLFSKRSKLYRWDVETSQWKERGVGDVMIKHNTLTNTFRILMRREQVLKVCANHYITPQMKLEASFSSDQAWTWLAADYADDEEKIEKFAIKFKTPEFAQEFKDQFEECQLVLRKKTDEKGEKKEVSALLNNAEKMKSELGFFKDKLSAKSKVNLEKTLTDESPSSSNVPFDPSIQLTPLVKQHEKNKEKLKDQESKSETSEVTAAASNKTASTAKTSLQLDKFAFQINTDPSKAKEEASGVRKDQERNVSVCSALSEEADVHFEPIIPLPAKVTVRTGEENEQAVFEERCKVYIFDREGTQWKERGVGKVRLLQNVASFKMRMVMRREQVLKVCLNQMILNDTNFDFKENSAEKIVVWTGTDFSDTDKIDGETHQFAIRFKTCDEATEFLRCIEEGRIALKEKRLLQAIIVEEDQSVASEAPADITDEPSEDPIKSPVKSPVKPAKPLFSFATMESPFGKKTQFGGFSFGDTPKSSANQKPFSFNVNAMAFNLGATSTPISVPSGQVQPPGASQNGKVEQSDSGATSSIPGVFSLSSSNVPSSADQSKPTQVQQSAPAASESQEPVKFCIPGVDEDLKQIENKSTQQPELSVKDDNNASSSSSSSSEESSSDSSSEEEEDQRRVDDVDAVKDVDDVVPEDDDDVIFVCETIPTEEQLRKAKELLLPPTFCLYEDLQNEDCDSEGEDYILEYIARRDNPDLHFEESLEQEEEEEVDQEEVDVSEDQESQLLEQSESSVSSSVFFTPRKDLLQPSGEPLAVISQTHVTANVGEPQQREEGLFQSFANMSNFSFSAMAAASSENKHSFGSRTDDAFKVSDENKVLFTNQTEDGNDADQAHDPHYEPLLAELPPLVELKTGEEDEQVRFKERCKLYRFDDDVNAWKERGVGDLKVLHHPILNSFRIVMRREQVLKICANHRILKEMSLIENGEKGFSYVAQDRSENDEVKVEKLAVKFKNPEIAQNFRKVWEKAREETS